MFGCCLMQFMFREAMYTVDKDYSVVGVLEMFNTSLDVFDAYLPGVIMHLHIYSIIFCKNELSAV